MTDAPNYQGRATIIFWENYVSDEPSRTNLCVKEH